MENIQISYDGERVEITFKKGEAGSFWGCRKSWDDMVAPCCMDTDDDPKPVGDPKTLWADALAVVFGEVFTAEQKEKEGTLAYHLLADYASKASSAEKKKKSAVINEDQREACRVAAARIAHAFVWGDTREGHDYWSKVFSRLSQIAEDGVL